MNPLEGAGGGDADFAVVVAEGFDEVGGVDWIAVATEGSDAGGADSGVWVVGAVDVEFEVDGVSAEGCGGEHCCASVAVFGVVFIGGENGGGGWGGLWCDDVFETFGTAGGVAE